ncbi:MAG: MotA/TolQ/ExbB proton channel family protein [Planctomycetota bacterium]
MFDLAVQRFGGEWLNSYFTATWVHMLTTAVFFVGMAALVIRGLGVLGQFGVVRRPLIDPIRSGGQPVEEAGLLIEQLERQPSWLQKTYLVARLRSILDYVLKAQSADSVESQLRTLEEADCDRMSAGYSMVRVITGVVPLLGFLGTVIGITEAIGGLSINPEQLEASMGNVIAGLSGAFSTTALALALSIVLVFTKLIVERFEDNLLFKTGERAYQELVGRFEQYGTATDPHVASMSRMCDQVVRAVEVMAARQADLWKSTIDETHDRWALATSTAGEQLTTAVTVGLRKSLEDHATGMAQGMQQQLAQLNANLSGQTDALAEAVASQSTTLSGAVATQLTAMSDAVTQQSQAVADAVQSNVSVLREVVERNSTQLDSGSKEMLGNLRDGLERMAELLVEALQKHGQTLTQAEQELASENRRHLGEVEAALGEAMVIAADRQEKLINRSEKLLQGMQASVSESASVTIAHQEQLVKQGEVLLKVVESTGQVRALGDSLNQNLDALARSHNLEETLMSLSAAIQLLSARAGRLGPDAGGAAGQAA